MTKDDDVNELVAFVSANCRRISGNFGLGESIYTNAIFKTLQNLIAENEELKHIIELYRRDKEKMEKELTYRAEVINSRDVAIKQLRKRVRRLEKELHTEQFGNDGLKIL